MAKTRQRDEKFKMVLVRFPKSRAPELEAAANEVDLDVAKFVKTNILHLLNTRKKLAKAA